MSNGVPEFIDDVPVIPRTTSDDMTRPMYMIEHRVVKQDGPPELPRCESWDESDTEVDHDADTLIIDVAWAS